VVAVLAMCAMGRVIGALWDFVPRVCGGEGGCAGGGVPLWGLCSRSLLVWGGVYRGYTYHRGLLSF